MDKFNDDVMAAIESAPLDTRRRWYADLNAYQLPADFPVQGLVPPAPRDEVARSKWRAAFQSVSDTLPADEASWGWWKYNMERSFPEWLGWWKGRGLKTKITEQTA